MKRTLLSILLAFIAVATYANSTAKETDVSSIVITKVAYTLDLGDITELSNQDLAYKVDRVLNKLTTADSELECTVSLKGKVGTSGTGVEVEVTVTGPCDEVRKKAKEMLKEMMEDIKELIK